MGHLSPGIDAARGQARLAGDTPRCEPTPTSGATMGTVRLDVMTSEMIDLLPKDTQVQPRDWALLVGRSDQLAMNGGRPADQKPGDLIATQEEARWLTDFSAA